MPKTDPKTGIFPKTFEITQEKECDQKISKEILESAN